MHLSHSQLSNLSAVIISLFSVDFLAAQNQPFRSGSMPEGLSQDIWQETVNHTNRYQLPNA